MSGMRFWTVGKTSALPANVTEFKDRHGKWRLRFRAKGRQTYYFKHKPGTEEFRLELEACRAGESAPKVRTAMRMKPGTVSALIGLYYGTPEFTGLGELTRYQYRKVLERFREAHGDKRVASLQRKHIKAILGGMSAKPTAANNLLDRLRGLMGLALDEEWIRVDPTHGIKPFKIKSTGYHSWTEDEIAKYETRHPIGTKARLALDLLLYTTQRRSDGITLGKQHVRGNKIVLVQKKTGTSLELVLLPELRRSIDAASRAGVTGDLTFLVTSKGLPFTGNGFGNKMREWCDEAELTHCSAHGLRKAGARRMAEAGKSNPQIKSVTGHKTDKEVTTYVAAASQKRLAETAAKGLARPKRSAK